MPSGRSKPPLIVILGPTAVGKTEVALVLAETFEAEIVSADSRLFYRRMDIGTAKPTHAEQKRVPHHLIDIADPDQTISLAEYQTAARQVIASIHARGRLPFLVGGTGQYIHALTQGWVIPASPADLPLRKALERWAEEIGKEGLHARLGAIDPEAAAGIDPQNLRRTVRALEVILKTGRPFSRQRRKRPPDYRILQIGLFRPRPELYERIDERLEQMVAEGLIGEVKDLLAAGYAPGLPALSAIGYGEFIRHLQGEISLAEALRLIRRRSRLLVRRQANWFKVGDPDIHWIDVDALGVEKAVERIGAFLAEGT